MKIANADKFTEKTTFGDTVYEIAYFFENKLDPTNRAQIKSNYIKKFSYIDDISNVGIVGTMIIENTGGIFNQLLNNTDQFYIGYYSYNTHTKYKENIYFSIVQSTALERSSTSSKIDYELVLEESFMVDGATKNFNFLSLGLHDSIGQKIGDMVTGLTEKFNIKKEQVPENLSYDDKNLQNLVNFGLTLVQCNLNIPQSATSGTVLSSGTFFNDFALSKSNISARTVNIDEDGLKYFEKFDSAEVGEGLSASIDDTYSCLDFLTTINNNFFFKSIDSQSEKLDETVNGDLATARNENMAYMPYILKSIYSGEYTGDRRYCIKCIKDLFESCFKNKTVYEKLINKENKALPDDISKYKAIFTLKTDINNIRNYPVNATLINDIWCDSLIAPRDSDDTVDRIFLKFDDVVDKFNKEYLNDKYELNIKSETNTSRGIKALEPAFSKEDIPYTVCSRLIRSFFTLNEMTEFNLAGNSYRKANEIICIDPQILSSGSPTSGTETTFGNSLQNKFYYVTKVEHTFIGTQYNNTISICSFCKNKTIK